MRQVLLLCSIVIMLAAAPAAAAQSPASATAGDSVSETTTESITVFVEFSSFDARERASFDDSPFTVVDESPPQNAPILTLEGPEGELSHLAARDNIETLLPIKEQPAADAGGSVSAQSTGSAQAQSVPWGIDRINARSSVQKAEKGGLEDVNVAILSTGIDANHPDLDGNVEWGGSAMSGSFVAGIQNANDTVGTGTEIAGIVAAEDNSAGVVGANPHADLYAIKVADQSGPSSDAVAAGVEAALAGPDGQRGTEDDAHVIILPSRGSSADAAEQQAITTASKEAVVVAGVGDSGSSGVTYPAAYSPVAGVSAHDRSNSVISSSNTGSNVEVAAPGKDIQTTTIGQGYTSVTGTEYAAAHFAGATALMWALDLEDGEKETTGPMQQSVPARYAIDIGPSGTDAQSGAGRIDTSKFIKANYKPIITSVPTTTTYEEASTISTTVKAYDFDGNITTTSFRQTKGYPFFITKTSQMSFDTRSTQVATRRQGTIQVSIIDEDGAESTIDTEWTVRVNDPSTSRYDLDGDGSIDQDDVDSFIESFDRQGGLGGIPISAKDVLWLIENHT